MHSRFDREFSWFAMPYLQKAERALRLSMVISGNIELNYCKSENMVADLFTKPLSGPQFKRLRELLGLTAIEEEC